MKYLKTGLASFLLAGILNFAINLINLQEIFPQYQSVAEEFFKENGYYVLFFSLLIAPVVEEFLFRWLVFRLVRQRAGKIITCILSGFLFGLYHGNVIQFIYGFIMGMGFACVYDKYKDIKVAMVAHVAANLCAVLLSISSLHF